MKNNKVCLLQIILIFFVSLLIFVALEIGNHNKTFLDVSNIYLNVGTIFFFVLLCYYICLQHWLSVLFSVVLLHVMAVINYYTILYRGMPFTLSDIANALTAANVMQGYSFSVTTEITMILLCFLLSIGCIIIIKHRCTTRKYCSFQLVAVVICCVLFVYTGYISDDSIKPKQTLGWSWKESYYHYGYLASTLEVFHQSFNPVMKPQSYDESNLKELIPDNQSLNQNQFPDIILILNETYYDLRQVLDITLDQEYMQNYNNLDNAIKGYAVAPFAGGGTNNSEYELLASNSLHLLPRITPFNTLNLNNANSIVSFLQYHNYYTIGAHSEPALNYSRGTAYIDLGFDKTYFEGDFVNLEYYHNRYFETDSSIYANLTHIYENMPEETPRFVFLLTIQNHGGYNMNDSFSDIVHIKENFGEYTDNINEYLTSMYLSDIALNELIDFYEDYKRPVIICMLGDHSPVFVNELVNPSDRMTKLKMHSTPFFIWANFPIEEKDLGYIGMNALVPNILKVAGMPLSPYYQYILDLQEQIPVLTAYGMYMDKNGQFYSYDDETVYTSAVNQYFNMEYNNIGKHANRIQELFVP